MKYIVLDLVAGAPNARAYTEASTLRQARSAAYRRARRLRPAWLTKRPAWCDGDAWKPHGDAPGGEPVGGYDVGDDGSATIIYRVPPC